MIFDELPITRLFALIGGIQAKSRRLAERTIRASGLTYSQYGVLVALGENDGLPQKSIADRLETDANTVMVIVDSLEAKSFVTRMPSPSDKRLRLVTLTEAGRSALLVANQAVAPLYRDLAARFSGAELAQAEGPLARMYAILKEEEAKPR
jgi:DNA-binding MarR family transcriptional regulator